MTIIPGATSQDSLRTGLNDDMEHAYSIDVVRTLLATGLVLTCCVTDLRARRIPNAILLPVLMAGLFLNTLGGGLSGFADSIGGLLAGIGLLLPLYLSGRMGAGDVKLLGVVGAILGVWGAVAAGLATMVVGGLLGIAYLLWHLVGSPMTFSSSESTGAAAAVEIPYAVAIAGGTIAALVYLSPILEVIIK